MTVIEILQRTSILPLDQRDELFVSWRFARHPSQHVLPTGDTLAGRGEITLSYEPPRQQVAAAPGGQRRSSLEDVIRKGVDHRRIANHGHHLAAVVHVDVTVHEGLRMPEVDGAAQALETP